MTICPKQSKKAPKCHVTGKVNDLIPDGGFRMPTEAEWEYACRAGTTTPFHYGQNLDANMANFDGRYYRGKGDKGKFRQRTLAVGSFRPNAWGLYDMHGNVFECCQDWYNNYPIGDVIDPVGLTPGPFRVDRGGGWSVGGHRCRSANRNGGPPVNCSPALGLRLARNAQ